jgi:hypothetical protein
MLAFHCPLLSNGNPRLAMTDVKLWLQDLRLPVTLSTFKGQQVDVFRLHYEVISVVTLSSENNWGRVKTEQIRLHISFLRIFILFASISRYLILKEENARFLLSSHY